MSSVSSVRAAWERLFAVPVAGPTGLVEGRSIPNAGIVAEQRLAILESDRRPYIVPHSVTLRRQALKRIRLAR